MLAVPSDGDGYEAEPPVSYRERTLCRDEGGTSFAVTTVLNGVESCLSTNTGRVDAAAVLASRS